MGVSADSNTDLGLAVEGGPGFTQRLAELNAAKKAYDKSLSDLNLGRDAAAAKDEAGRILSAAKDKHDADMAALDVEVAKTRDDLNTWVENTRTETMKTLSAARSALDDAKIKQDAADVAHKAALSTQRKSEADATTLLQNTESHADDLLADAQSKADKITAAAEKLRADLKAAIAEAEASKQRHDDVVARMKDAMLAGD